MKDHILNELEDHRDMMARITESHIAEIEKIAQLLIEILKAGKKILLFGNGGSAADAQHFAGELVVRFKKNRPALPALALTTDTSILTATGNDFSFDEVFSRQVEAFADKGDVCIGFSTSGTSSNVLAALNTAEKKGAVTVGFTGRNGGALKKVCNAVFIAPAATTDRIQECHELVIHILCDLIEEGIYGRS